MDKTALEFTGGGLKCDNPDCDFVDMSIPINDYKKWVNAPCPKCGANLLTKQDYRLVKLFRGIARTVNFIYFFIPKKWLKKKLEQKYGEFNENDRATMSIKFDGTGEPKFGPIIPYRSDDK